MITYPVRLNRAVIGNIAHIVDATGQAIAMCYRHEEAEIVVAAMNANAPAPPSPAHEEDMLWGTRGPQAAVDKVLGGNNGKAKTESR